MEERNRKEKTTYTQSSTAIYVKVDGDLFWFPSGSLIFT